VSLVLFTSPALTHPMKFCHCEGAKKGEKGKNRSIFNFLCWWNVQHLISRDWEDDTKNVN